MATQIAADGRQDAGTRRSEPVADEGCAAAPIELPALSRPEAERVADLFKVLGDPTRVLILQALIGAGEICVHDLSAAVGTSQSAASHHMRILRHFDLVRQRRDGREIFYRPDDEHVEQLIAVCAEHIIHRKGALDA